MNYESLARRIQSLKAMLESLRPKQSPPALVVEFVAEINKNAPEGTTNPWNDGPRPDRMVMVPVGCRDQLPTNTLTHEEWLRFKPAKGDGKAN